MEFSNDDPRVVFDDVYGDPYYGIVTGEEDSADAAHRILRRVRARRLRPTGVAVLGTSYDPTYHTFEVADVVYRVIGDDVGLPVFADLHRRFAAALPAPKFARFDTPESYRQFREARRAPHAAELERRLAELEGASELDFDDAGEAVLEVLPRATRGGDPIEIPLALPAGTVECWQDGPEVVCTVRYRTLAGEPRLATTGAPLNRHLIEVVDAAAAEEVDPETVMAVGPAVSQLVGVSDLLSDLCGVVARGIDDGVGVAVLAPASDPATAAAMALLQRCQRGERAACADVAAMSRSHRDLLQDAYAKLVRGQEEKAGGRA